MTQHRIMLFLFAAIWISLIIRIFDLSVNNSDRFDLLANSNTIKHDAIMPVRGEIHDRNDRAIAINKLGFKIEIASHLSQKAQRPLLDATISRITSYLPELNATKIKQRYLQNDSYYNHEDVEVVNFIDYKLMLPHYTQLSLNEQITIKATSRRFYPYGKEASHLIGYVSKANQNEIKEDQLLSRLKVTGKNGVEKYYNRYLEGEAGKRTVKVTAYNEEVEQISYKRPLEQRNIMLTIDMDLQRHISSLFNKKVGAVVVMKSNGEILAAGSYPQYDLNSFATGISTVQWNQLIQSLDAPFTNKYINGLYPPGSTVKPALGLYYITSGKLFDWTTFECNGSLKLGRRNFRCWKHQGHGKTSIVKAIRESCDDYFYKGSLRVGIANMSQALKHYGLGEKTGIDLPNEFIGTVPNRAWKAKRYHQPWYIGETLNSSIGQGNMLATPMQVTQLTALIATGKKITPHVLLQQGDKNISITPKDILSTKEKIKLPLIRRAMYQVCNHVKGTATHYLHTKVKLAGKTGTAQVVGISQEIKERAKEHDMEYYRRSHAWFTTYAPYNSPKVIVTILVEHGGHGGAAAGAITSDIYNYLKQHHYLQ